MKSKNLFSAMALFIFAMLGGGSFSGDDFWSIFAIIMIIVVVIIFVAIVSDTIQTKNKNKRLQMIKEDEQNSTDFDRTVFIGDDRCKIYFDSKRKQVMIMRVMTEGIKKEYIDNFEFPGKQLADYNGHSFNIYDPIRRKLLTGSYNDLNIEYKIACIADKDKNKDVPVNNTIQPMLKTHNVSDTTYNILLDECHGLIAVSEHGAIRIFNYINSSSLPRKKGDKSFITQRPIGRYLFMMDDFFKVLVIIKPGYQEIFNYSDIIEVSYEENGDKLYTK